MSNKTLAILLVLVMGSIGTLFLVNTAALYRNQTSSNKFISLNDIEGMAVVHNDKAYTLNFEQQNKVAAIINHSVIVERDGINKHAQPFGYEYLLIYRFNQSPIKLTPVTLVNTQLILDVPEFSEKGFLRELGPGELNSLLSETYDNAKTPS